MGVLDQAINLPLPLQQMADTVATGTDHEPPSPSDVPPTFMPFGLKPSQLDWMKDIKYDKMGNIVDILKLDPRKFPSHR